MQKGKNGYKKWIALIALSVACFAGAEEMCWLSMTTTVDVTYGGVTYSCPYVDICRSTYTSSGLCYDTTAIFYSTCTAGDGSTQSFGFCWKDTKSGCGSDLRGRCFGT